MEVIQEEGGGQKITLNCRPLPAGIPHRLKMHELKFFPAVISIPCISSWQSFHAMDQSNLALICHVTAVCISNVGAYDRAPTSGCNCHFSQPPAPWLGHECILQAGGSWARARQPGAATPRWLKAIFAPSLGDGGGGSSGTGTGAAPHFSDPV